MLPKKKFNPIIPYNYHLKSEKIFYEDMLNQSSISLYESSRILFILSNFLLREVGNISKKKREKKPLKKV